MKNNKAPIFGLLLLLASTGWVLGALEFEQTTLEHQASLVDEEHTPVFKFTNTGSLPVTILEMRSSCGCTVPSLEKRTYGPGESGEIVAVFTFGPRVGRDVKNVTVVTDESGRKTHHLEFITHIPEWGSVHPRILRWKIGEPAKGQEIVLTIADPDGIRLLPPLPTENVTLAQVSTDRGKITDRATPKSTETRATENMVFPMETIVDGVTATRQIIVYSLIR